MGERETPWIKPEVVLSFFDKSENDFFKGKGGYKNFVEKYEPDPKEKKILEGIILESKSEHLERRIPALVKSKVIKEKSKDGNRRCKSRNL